MTHNDMSGHVIGAVAQVGNLHGDINFMRPSLPTPRQLWAAPRLWVNADEPWQELEQLCHPEARTPGVAVAAQLVAPGGMGTSALMTRYVHYHVARYPDGQLVARLAASHRAPTSVEKLLRRFVRDLGVPATEIPLDLDELAAMFRSVTATRAVAIVLDDVPEWMDLEPLIPANPEALLLASARRPIGSLIKHGVPVVTLTPLDRGHAEQLLTQIVGRRLPDTALRHLVAVSGCVPAAVTHIGIRLRRSADAGLTQTISAVLSDVTKPMPRTTMDTPGGTEAWIVTALHALTPTHPTPQQQQTGQAAERLLQLLALLPAGSEFEPALAHALTSAVPGGQGAVEALLDVGLLLTRAEPTPSGEQRVSIADAADAYVRGKLGPTERDGSNITVQGKRAALRAICDWHWIRAHAAERLITGYRSLHPYDCTQPAPTDFTSDRRAALDWLDDHREVLVSLAANAFQYGLFETCLQLVDVSWPLFLHRGHYDLRGRMDLLGVKAAEEWAAVVLCDPTSSTAHLVDIVRFLAEMLKRLGRGWTRRGRRKALDVLRSSRRLYQRIGDQKGEAGACEAIANHYFKTKDHRRALTAFTDVLHRNRELGRHRQIALTHLNLADTCLALAPRSDEPSDEQPADTLTEHLADAQQHLQAARAAFAALNPPDRYNAARVRKSLGDLHLCRGQTTEASAELGAALIEFTDLNSMPEAIRTLRMLANVARRLGDTRLELEYLSGAQELHTVYGQPKDDDIADRLNQLAEAS